MIDSSELTMSNEQSQLLTIHTHYVLQENITHDTSHYTNDVKQQ